MKEGQFGQELRINLGIDDIKSSFQGSSVLASRSSPVHRGKTYLDFATQLREPIQINTPDQNQEVLRLDTVIPGFEKDFEHSANLKIDLSPIKTKSEPYSPKKRNMGRNTPVYFNNYDYYEKRVTQRNSSFSHIHGNSQIPESNNLSSYFQTTEKNQKEINGYLHDFDLQNLINEAKPFSKIQLPDQLIKIKKLVINKPLTIQGVASSILEVADSIHINIAGVNIENTVTFSECTIKFDYIMNKDILNQSVSTKRSKGSEIKLSGDKKSYSDHFNHNQSYFLNGQATTEIRKTEAYSHTEGRLYPLFVIHPNSTLEVRDSNISSKKAGTVLPNCQDVCFFLDYQLNAPTLAIKEADPRPKIYIQSTFISNFHTTVQNNLLGEICLERLFITNSLGHAINVSNPHVLDVKECTFENTTKSCINLRFSLEFTSDLKRKVLIEKNKLNKGSNYGISVFGENMKHQLCDIEIIENQLNLFEKDGIGFKNLNISQIKIEKNQITSCTRNGIFLQNLLDTVNFQQVKLIENKISHSHLYGLILMDVSCYSEKDEICQNLKSGIFLSGGAKAITKEEISFYKKYPLRSIISFANVYHNKEAGVACVGNLKGPVILNSCGIHENTNGVYIKQTSLDSSMERTGNSITQSPNKADPSCDPSVLSNIMFDKCAIFQNEISGLHLKEITTKAYLKETLIYDNKNYAIFIQNEAEKENLVFRDGDKSKVKEYISGYVGGSWGVVFEPNPSVCKRASCNMF